MKKSPYTTIMLKRGTREKLAILAGNTPVATWLNEMAEEKLAEKLAADRQVADDLLAVLQKRLESYKSVDAENWPEYKALLSVMIPTAMALETGKHRVDTDVLEQSIMAVLSNMPDNFPDEYRVELVDHFSAELGRLQGTRTAKPYLESLDLDNRPALRKLIYGGSDKQ